MTPKYDLRRVISFHGRVTAAREFSADVPGVIAWMPAHARPTGALWSEHVSGTMTSGQRDRLLLRFRNLAPNERGLLSNARCLGEGVDVPSIDGIAFIDPRHSTTDIIQAVGRAIRKAPDKSKGTIVLPVFLTDENPEQALENSAFKNVWEVLKALRAHDETLGDELDELRRNLGERLSPPRRPGKIKLDVPAAYVGSWFAEAFNTRLVERTTESWEFWYGLLQRYAEREGDAGVPMLHREGSYALGEWVGKQRAAFRAGELDPERTERLDSIPGWIWDHYEAEWEEGFARLRQFADRKGHARVPMRHREGDHRLGLWVAVQRRTFTRGQMSDSRVARLEAVVGWTWGALDEDWENGYRKLSAYVEREGDAIVPKAHVEDGFPLGQWVLRQRLAARRGKLTDERRERLLLLNGWAWDAREASWQQALQLLQQFVAREGHAQVPQQHQEDGFPLGE